MSDSDDTDILLLIPPDLFTVASSQSEDSLAQCHYPKKNHIVENLLGHVQSLEDRISAIETRENSLNPSLIDLTLSESRIDPDNNHYQHDLYHVKRLDSTQSVISQPSASCEERNYIKLQNFTLPGSLSSNVTLFKDTNFKRGEIVPELLDIVNDDIIEYKKMPFITKNNPTATTMNNTSKAIFNDDYDRISTNKNDKRDEKCEKNCSVNEMTDLSLMQHDTLSSNKHLNYITLLDKRNKKLDQSVVDCENSERNKEIKTFGEINELPLNTEYKTWQSQRLISLSDFWHPDCNKSEVEIMRIKVEEEKFRREHCEELIVELQRKLLEQEEKVAVAIRVDKEKSDIIIQFQTIWNKFKKHWNVLETDYNKLQSSVETIKSIYENEIANQQLKIKDKDDELLRVNNLMSECEAKLDATLKQKIVLLESHVNELEKYKSLVQTAECRCETIQIDYDKLSDKYKELDEINKNIQQELCKERLKNNEVRSEMTVVHKALDTCEAELTILRQEKENLLLKLKEEDNRINILEKNKLLLTQEVDNAKKSENLARSEMNALVSQQETKRSELRNIYQNQVDEVVNIKLKEFQSQLDAAELTFQMELDAKQRAIAECAARKIKNIIDKHQLEINLIEEKHTEEKRLYDIRLSQTKKKLIVLESQLNAQNNAKTRLADQLHSLMEKQYHQALQIISTENIAENHHISQWSNNDKFIESNNIPSKSDNFTGVSYVEPVKLQTFKMEKKQLDYQSGGGSDYDENLIAFMSSDESPTNKLIDSKDDLKKYIKMILQLNERKKHFVPTNIIENNNSNSSIEMFREIPKKIYLKAEAPDDSSDMKSYLCDASEEKNHGINTDFASYQENKYLPIRTITQMDRQKPPWK